MKKARLLVPVSVIAAVVLLLMAPESSARALPSPPSTVMVRVAPLRLILLEKITFAPAAEVAQIEPKENEVSNPAPVLSIKEKASASLEAELIMALQREKGQSDVMIERIADRVTLTFPERIVFDPGQARLKPTCQSTLEKVASFIHDRPFLLVEVQGHTDDKPINTSRYPSNWELSVDRATQVSRSLIGLGVNPTQLSVKGFGEYRPLLPNDSDTSRLTNRRVEIQFSVSPQS